MQDFIDKLFFNFILFALFFGVVFYDTINILGFSYVDELCAAFLLILFLYKVFKSQTWAFDKKFLFVIGVFAFYLIYSIVISSNTTGAILTDFVIQAKPYLAFFCVYAIEPKLSDNQRKIIRQLTILCCFYVLIVGLLNYTPIEAIEITFSHHSRLATTSSILAMLYLYCSDYRKIDKLIFILILAIGILSGRSKHFGFFAICSLLILYFNDTARMKLNVKNLTFLIIALAVTIFVTRDKFYFYFVTGGFGDGRTAQDLYARMALYFFSLNIFIDYMPFGSGFASYATYASGAYYSPIYGKYGMERMYGLTKDAPDFIADTYYPALAQFGVVGVILFFTFWISLAIKALKSYSICMKESLMALLIIIFILIECTTDATITHNRGMFMMIMLGLIFYDIRKKTTTCTTSEKSDDDE